MRPQPPPPTFFCKNVIPGQLFLRLHKDVILRDLFFAGFPKRFSAESADSKRVPPLTMRPGRRSLRKLFWDLYKSVILNELLCAAARGWVCKEALPRIFERGDSSSDCEGLSESAGSGGRESDRERGNASASARSFRMHIGCTPVPSMFYIFYRASKDGLWKFTP